MSSKLKDEALDQILDDAKSIHRHPYSFSIVLRRSWDIMEIIAKIKSEPPRNCDVGTAEEQSERFILFCRRNSFRGVCNDSCKFANANRRLGWQTIGQARCFPFWAQMPYVKGETDEQK